MTEPEPESAPVIDTEDVEAAVARVRAANADGRTAAPGDVARLVAALDQARAESAARWEAIGRLASAAKANRTRARDATRLLDDLRAALAAGVELAPLLNRLAAPEK